MKLADILKAKKEYLTDFAKYVEIIRARSWEVHKDKLLEFVTMRGIPLDILLEHEIFYIHDYSELMPVEYIDKLKDFGLINELNNMPIFHERWIIPIKDFDGNIINLVGYTPYSENRYLYGNARYYDRKNDMFGMENYKDACEKGWAIYVEGITDCLAVRAAGFSNCFASCGTMQSDIKMRHLNQLENGVIFISDRDKAGDTTLKHWRTNTCVYLSISIEYKLKDIDDYLNKNINTETKEKDILGPNSCIRAERLDNFKYTIDAAVAWLKSQMPHSKVIEPNIKYASLTLV